MTVARHARRQRRDARLRAPLGRRPVRAAGDEGEELVADVVDDRDQPARAVQQQDQHADAAGEQLQLRAALEHGGDGDDHERAEHGAGDRRQPADHGDREHAEGFGRHEVVGDLRGVPGREQPARERRDAAGDRECDELGARGGHRVGGGVRLVVANREQRAAHTGPSEVAHDHDHDERADEAEVVVGALVGGEVEPEHRRWFEAHPEPGERGVEPVLQDHVAADRQREAERDDAQVEAAHAQRRDSDHDRDPDAPQHTEPDRREEPELCGVVRREVRAEGDEGELTERQLAGPAREHGRGDRHHQEDQHGRVVDESAGQGLELWQQEAEREQDRDPAVSQQPRQRVAQQLLTSGARARGQAPRRLVAALRPRAEQHEQHEQDEDHQRVGARVLGRVRRGRCGRRRRARHRRASRAGTTSCDRRARQRARRATGSGPNASLTSLARWFSTGPASRALTEARTPARTHTWVDTALHPDPGERRRARVVGRRTHRRARISCAA